MISFFYPSHYAHAQRVYGSRAEEDVRPFAFSELNGALDLRFRYENDQLKGPSGAFLQKDTRFDERLDLKGRGSVYHPNFLDFNFDTSFGLRQDRLSGDATETSFTFPYEYMVNLRFLQAKPYTFNLFANRMSETVSRMYFAPIQMDSNFYGGVFRYQKGLFPALLLLQSSENREDSVDYKRSWTEKKADLRISNRLGDILSSELQYIYQDTVEENPVRQEITSNNLYLRINFDYKQTHGVSNILYLKNAGVLATDQVQVNENFYVDHSSALTSLYSYYLNYFSSERFTSLTNRGNIGLRHKLYDSLTTEVRGEISLTDGTDFREFYYLDFRTFKLHWTTNL